MKLPDKLRPWYPAEWEPYLPALYAVQGLGRGDATPEQQKLALDFIINVVCKTYDMSFYPDSERDSTFAEGKRFVGNQIIRLLKVTGDQIAQAKKQPKR